MNTRLVVMASSGPSARSAIASRSRYWHALSATRGRVFRLFPHRGSRPLASTVRRTSLSYMWKGRLVVPSSEISACGVDSFSGSTIRLQW